MSKEYISLGIPKKLYEEITKRVNESQGEFKNVNEYVEFVLSEVTKEEDENKPAYTPEEEKEIKKRLEKLGYL